MADAARIQRDITGTVSYLGRVRKEGALRVQAATPARLKRAMAGLSRAALTRRPAPGKWSIQEIVCHLADVEVVNGWRYRMILAQSGSPLTTSTRTSGRARWPTADRTRPWPSRRLLVSAAGTWP